MLLQTESEKSGEEKEESMTRQTSKGTCTFCHGELSKSGMTRHLESCQQRAAMQTEERSRQKAQKTRAFHLVVEGRYLPMYWMHLEVAAETTLATLDRFLRDTWLECCGHLSAFEIGGVRYSVDAGMYDWDTGSKSMRVQLDKVLRLGQTCSYEYDFGSTTELTLKVVSEREVEAKGKAVQVLARNNPPLIPCDVCGEPATRTCAQCIYEDEGYLCDACAKDHKCGEEMLLPRVNSPRAGVCGYTGQDPAYTW
jgi:Plasmid pRiA4b ORF-3-like protein